MMVMVVIMVVAAVMVMVISVLSKYKLACKQKGTQQYQDKYFFHKNDLSKQ